MADDCIICGKWPERDRWALPRDADRVAPARGTYLRRSPASVRGAAIWRGEADRVNEALAVFGTPAAHRRKKMRDFKGGNHSHNLKVISSSLKTR